MKMKFLITTLIILIMSCSSGGSNNGSTPDTGGSAAKTYGLRVTKRVIEDFSASKSKHDDIFSVDESAIVQRFERDIQSQLQTMDESKLILDQRVNEQKKSSNAEINTIKYTYANNSHIFANSKRWTFDSRPNDASTITGTLNANGFPLKEKITYDFKNHAKEYVYEYDEKLFLATSTDIYDYSNTNSVFETNYLSYSHRRQFNSNGTTNSRIYIDYERDGEKRWEFEKVFFVPVSNLDGYGELRYMYYKSSSGFIFEVVTEFNDKNHPIQGTETTKYSDGEIYRTKKCNL